MNKSDHGLAEWVSVLNVPVSVVGVESATELIVSFLNTDDKHVRVVFTPTTEQVVMASEEARGKKQEARKSLLECFEQADMNLPDTLGIVLAERVLVFRQGWKPRLTERVSGVDMMQMLFAEALKQGKKVFLLGGKGTTAEKAAKALKSKYKISDSDFQRLVMWDAGARDVENESEKEVEAIIERINKFGADVVFVAYGAPWQERWVIEHRDELKVKVVMVVGGALDMLSGNVSRAPVKWRKFGLEWLWRLVHQPWRWRRQLRLVKFVGMVAREVVRG